MYEMLGLTVSSYIEVSDSKEYAGNDSENEFEDITAAEEINNDEDSSDDSQHVVNYNNELVIKDPSPLKNNHDDDGEPNIAKRPFLKRGAGLTNRFRIAPDAFNLKKLPRYKYADRIKMNLAKNGHQPAKERPKDSEPLEKQVTKLKKQKKVTEESAPSKSTSESTELIAPLNTVLKIPSKLLSQAEEPQQVQDWFEKYTTNTKKDQEIQETPKAAKDAKAVSWAQILSSNNIMDSPSKRDPLMNLQNDSDFDESNLFQLLEERINNLSMNTSSTSILKLLASLKNNPFMKDNDKTIVNPDDPLVDDSSSVNLHLEPQPSEVNAKVVIDTDSEYDDNDYEPRVRFADNVEVVEEPEEVNDGETILSTDLDAIELSQTSTPNERQKFQDFKKKLLGHKITQLQPQHQIVIDNQDNLRGKSDLLKLKIQELESEINSFRMENANIMKMRQELELDRVQMEAERDDMVERLKDDRIKMEMMIHDERLKLEQDRQKLDKLLRDAKNPNRKEREETLKLKEQVEELKTEMKEKEARHGSSQSRFRAQIRQLEKENQSLKLEMEVIKKDNKKLEVENARLRRDTNNKMLQEINKNIAKLAPQAQAESTTKKPEVAKNPTMNRKSDPASKKRIQSVPDLSRKSSESDEESDREAVASNYFRKSNKENHPRRSDPVRKTETDSKSSSDVLTDMKREINNSDGSKDIWYPNGNLKKISPDGMLIRMLYYNKDIKETNITEGTIKYYYADRNTWHTTYIDGLEILEYPE